MNRSIDWFEVTLWLAAAHLFTVVFFSRTF
jgi:hypothetical protein